MNVAALIDALEQMPEDAEVRIADIGYRSAFEYHIDDIVSPAEVIIDDESVVYLAQGSQIGYLPSEAREELA